MKTVRLAALFPSIAAAGVMLSTGCTTSDTASHHGAMSEGTLVANTHSLGNTRTHTEARLPGAAEGIVRHRGQMYYMKSRGTTIIRPGRITQNLTLERNGDVTLADGRRLRVMEGWMVTLGGELREAPPWVGSGAVH
jgi:hypothetical protein